MACGSPGDRALPDIFRGRSPIAAGPRSGAPRENAIADTVLAHRESSDFAPFDDADYSNAYGPTVHFPVARNQVDTWAMNGISETDNAFYKSVGAADLAKVIA